MSVYFCTNKAVKPAIFLEIKAQRSRELEPWEAWRSKETGFPDALFDPLDNTGLKAGQDMGSVTQCNSLNLSEHQDFHLLREGIAFISHISKWMLKILQARLQQYVNHELPDVQAGFRKPRETRNQITNIRWITKKAREFQKNIESSLLTMPKPLTVWITTNCGTS